jgi:hypothetical protein
VKDMSARPQSFDPTRRDRALDRLYEHCELVANMTARIEERRVVVRAELERRLGPELTRTLLTALASPA